MSRSSESEELQVNQFSQGDTQLATSCEDCNRTLPARQQWWRKSSYEYDEWDCRCRKCALAWIHQYDDFDESAYVAAMTAKGAAT